MIAFLFRRSGDRGVALEVTSGSWKDSITPPWGSGSLTVAGTARVLPGDWVAIVAASGRLVGLGKVRGDNLSAGVVTAGPSLTDTISIVGWLDAADFNDLVSIPGAQSRTVGTLFDFDAWYAASIGPFVETLGGANMGPQLQKLADATLRYRVAPGLRDGFSGYIGDAVNVAWDDESARDVGARGPYEQVQGFSLNGLRSLSSAQTKVGEMIRQTFAPSGALALAELYPSIEPANLSRVSARPAILGSKLVLNYRMRPLRVKSLYDSLIVTSSQSSITNFQTLADFDPDAFKRATWGEAMGVVQTIGVTLEGTSLSRGEENRANAFAAWVDSLPGAEFAMFEQLGFPILSSISEVEDEGLRIAYTNWPFMPPLDSKVARETVLAFIKRITAQRAQFEQDAWKLYSGQVVTGLDTSLRVGFPTRFVWGGRAFVGYAVAVEHRWTDRSGGPSGTTTVSVVRVTDNEDDRLTQVEVPGMDLQPASLVTTTPAPPAPAQSNAPRCSEGAPGLFPVTLEETRVRVDLTRVPKDLRDWAVRRGFDDREINPGSTPTQKREDRLRAILVNAACMRVVEYYWQQEFPSAKVKVLSSVRGDSNHAARAASDFVVLVDGEPLPALQLWGSLNRLGSTGAGAIPDARRIPIGGRGLYLNLSSSGVQGAGREQAGLASKVRSGLRGPFPLGGSAGVHYDFRSRFGFKTERTSGDTWAAIDGVLRNNATSTLNWIAMGRPLLSRALLGGDGKDEFQMYVPYLDEETGAPNYAADPDGTITMNFLKEHVYGVWKYVLTNGADDQSLLPVGPTVPNAMQVLGQVDSCFVPRRVS